MDDNQKRNIQSKARLEDVATVLFPFNAMRATFEGITNKDIGCIFYIFDRSETGSGVGFNSKNCDVGDAMVAIKRIAAQFGMDLEILAEDK